MRDPIEVAEALLMRVDAHYSEHDGALAAHRNEIREQLAELLRVAYPPFAGFADVVPAHLIQLENGERVAVATVLRALCYQDWLRDCGKDPGRDADGWRLIKRVIGVDPDL